MRLWTHRLATAFFLIGKVMQRFLREDAQSLELTFMESLDFVKRKGMKISLTRPLLDVNSRTLVKSIYTELDKGLVGTGDVQLFLRSVYKVIYNIANTLEVPIEDSTFDNPKVEYNRGIEGMSKYGKKIELNDLDLGISTKKALIRMLKDFKKLKNNGTVFKLLDRIRIIIEILVESSNDSLTEAKLDNLCEVWRIK